MFNIMLKKKKSQVWVETVTYTLIALILIGLVLAFVRPKLEEMKDKATLDQTLTMLEELNNDISDTAVGASGSQRISEFTIKSGYIEVITLDYNDSIVYTLEKSNSEYTEPGKIVSIGNILVNTTDRGKYNIVQFTLNYKERYDFVDKDRLSGKVITVPKSSTTQKLTFTNVGKNGAERTPGIPPTPGLIEDCSTTPCTNDKGYEKGICIPGTQICKYEDIRSKVIVNLN